MGKEKYIPQMRQKLATQLQTITKNNDKKALLALIREAEAALKGTPIGMEVLLPFAGTRKVPVRNKKVRAYLETAIKQMHDLLEKLHGHPVSL